MNLRIITSLFLFFSSFYFLQAQSDVSVSFLNKTEKTQEFIFEQNVFVQITNNRNSSQIEIPFPDSNPRIFVLEKASILHPDLQKKYPDIKSYKGWSANNDYLRISYSPKGFRAMVITDEGEVFYVDPIKEKKGRYKIQVKSDLENINHDFTCGTKFENTKFKPKKLIKSRVRPTMKKFKLALACNKDYSDYFGGTVEGALIGMNNTMTRVSGIYERYLGYTFEIVADNEKIIFLDDNIDPYKGKGAGQVNATNQLVCDDSIGYNNYDIGHVFLTNYSNTNLASIEVVCTEGKAKGTKGLSTPEGDGFNIDYVCHEMGHQFGANHTFNNLCGTDNINEPTAFEPGSGNTIMSYAGVCSPNVQSHSDPYFHGQTILEIENFISTQTCYEEVSVGNIKPDIQAGPDYTIPQGTYFFLEATGDDQNGDPLTYSWEQLDNEISSAPPISTATAGPVFKSFPPSSSPRRYFPNMNSILQNESPTWEVLPTVSRTLNFMCTAYDNHYQGGSSAYDEMLVNIDGTSGPFLVTSPNVDTIWEALTPVEVTWDVANTNSELIDCKFVEIYLSTDGGISFPHLIKDFAPNLGAVTFEVPSLPSEHCRLMIKGKDNIFFDISNQEFTIIPHIYPGIEISTDQVRKNHCNPNENVVFDLNIEGLAGYTGNVNLTLGGLPQGVNAYFSSNTITLDDVTTLTLSNFSSVDYGLFSFQVYGQSGTMYDTLNLDIENFESPIEKVFGLYPNVGVDNQNSRVDIGWTNVMGVSAAFVVKLAKNPSFTLNPQFFNTTEDHFIFSSLEEQTIYYWQVVATDGCANIIESDIYSFRTGDFECYNYDFPEQSVNIKDENETTFELVINDSKIINNLETEININHPFIGDVAAKLITPANKVLHVFDRPGVPEVSQWGCGSDDMRLRFKDSASLSSSNFEETCDPDTNQIGIEGDFQPIDPFYQIIGDSFQGTWKLLVKDFLYTDVGTLENWNLTLCDNIPISVVGVAQVSINNIELDNETSKLISQDNLYFSVDNNYSNGIYTIVKKPIQGLIKKGTQTLGVGDVFYQVDINNGNISYEYTGTETVDELIFDVESTEKHWLANNKLTINISEQFEGYLVLDNNLNCYQSNDGIISAYVSSGGTGNLTYSIDGINFQNSNIFSGLSVGTYFVFIKSGNQVLQTNSVTITQPDSLILNTTISVDKVTLDVTGGTAPYQYSKDGINYQASQVFNNLANGEYTFYVKDSKNCVGSKTITVFVENVDANVIINSHVSCFSGSNASVTVNVTSGTAPYLYKILDVTDFQSENIFSGLSSGNYQCQIKDVNGQLLNVNFYINQPSQIVINDSTYANNLFVWVSGGVSPFLVGVNDLAKSSGNYHEFFDLSSGNYEVNVIDDNGCQAANTITIQENTLDFTISKEDVKCNGSQSGQIQIIASGGNTPYLYSISNGAFQSTYIFPNLSSGTYPIVVKDNNGFELSKEVIIEEPQVIDISLSFILSNLEVSVTGGTPDFLFKLDNGSYQSSNQFSGLTDGTHTLFVKDANNCVQSSIFEYSSTSQLFMNIQKEDPKCYGEYSGSIEVNAQGGVIPYQYSIGGSTYQNDSIFAGLAAGNYLVFVKDQEGIIISNQVSIIEPNQLPNLIVLQTDSMIMVFPTNIFDQFSTDGINYQTSNEFINLPPGNHTFYGKTGDGCIMTKEFEVEALFNASYKLSKNCDDSTKINLIVFVNGGTKPYSLLVGGETYNVLEIDDLSNEIEQISVRDSKGKEIKINIDYTTLPNVLTFDYLVNENDLSINASGGVAPYFYALNNQDYTDISSYPDLADGYYHILVKDQDGCVAEKDSVKIGTVGVLNIDNDLKVLVYPNPVRDVLNIQLDSYEDYHFKLFNELGKQVLVRKSNFSGKEIQLDMKNVSGGIYFLHIQTGTQQAVVRIVVGD